MKTANKTGLAVRILLVQIQSVLKPLLILKTLAKLFLILNQYKECGFSLSQTSKP